MYGLARDERNITWLEVVAISKYHNHDFKDAIESFDRMFEVLVAQELGIPSMQKVIKAISCIDAILSVIGVNLFSYELERKALETKCKGLVLLEEYEEIAGIHIRLRDLNESLGSGCGVLKEASL